MRFEKNRFKSIIAKAFGALAGAGAALSASGVAFAQTAATAAHAAPRVSAGEGALILGSAGVIAVAGALYFARKQAAV